MAARADRGTERWSDKRPAQQLGAGGPLVYLSSKAPAMARQPLPIPLPVQPAPPLHLFPESNAATIAAASLEFWPSAAPFGPLTLPLLHATYALRIPNPHPANRSQLLKSPSLGR